MTILLLILYLITGATIVQKSTPEECMRAVTVIGLAESEPVYVIDGKETQITGAECLLVNVEVEGS